MGPERATSRARLHSVGRTEARRATPTPTSPVQEMQRRPAAVTSTSVRPPKTHHKKWRGKLSGFLCPGGTKTYIRGPHRALLDPGPHQLHFFLGESGELVPL